MKRNFRSYDDNVFSRDNSSVLLSDFRVPWLLLSLAHGIHPMDSEPANANLIVHLTADQCIQDYDRYRQGIAQWRDQAAVQDNGGGASSVCMHAI